MVVKQPSGALTGRVKQADEMTASTIFSVGFRDLWIDGLMAWA
jgi:hypothetical protein